jgi:hypothetical protein
VLCSRVREETTFYLFFLCPFSQRCLRCLHIEWNFCLDFFSMMDEAKKQVSKCAFHEDFSARLLADLETKKCLHLQANMMSVVKKNIF